MFQRISLLGIGTIACTAYGYRSLGIYGEYWFGFAVILMLITFGCYQCYQCLEYHKVPAMSTSKNQNKEFIPIPVTLHNTLDYSLYHQVLSDYVVDGRVKFVQLRKSMMRDKRKDSPFIKWLQILSKVGPDTTPNLFPNRDERLKFYLNAYNALTIYGVIYHSFYYKNHRTLISSVFDVKSRLEPKSGFGFFRSAMYELDGRNDVSLDHLEHNLIRKGFNYDARIHCAINCASTGCPQLKSYVIGVDHLDQLCKEFVNDSRNVSMDGEKGVIGMSQIFKWYQSDFEMFYDQREDQSDIRFDDNKLLYFVWKYADEELRKLVVESAIDRYQIEFVSYDWTLINYRSDTSKL